MRDLTDPGSFRSGALKFAVYTSKKLRPHNLIASFIREKEREKSK